VLTTCDVCVLYFGLKEQRSDDMAGNEEQQDQQHKEEESDSVSKPVLDCGQECHCQSRCMAHCASQLDGCTAAIGFELELEPFRIDT
jgi:hypothetical protein